jgi:hypothetical protein
MVTTFSSRKGTPLYYAKTDPALIAEALWWLAEGVDISVLVRRFGYHEETLAQWLNRAGEHEAQFHAQTFLHLNFDLIQMDELYAKFKDEEKARWLWLAIDPVSKALPALHLGGRRAADAYQLVHDLKQLCRLLTSSGQDSSLRQPIGSHDASRPESEYAGVETAVERPTVADWMGLESAR